MTHAEANQKEAPSIAPGDRGSFSETLQLPDWVRWCGDYPVLSLQRPFNGPLGADTESPGHRVSSYWVFNDALPLSSVCWLTSNSELMQVMIHMLVRQRCPFPRSHLSEKAMGMLRASFRTTGCEAVSPLQKPLPLHCEISFIAHDQALL